MRPRSLDNFETVFNHLARGPNKTILYNEPYIDLVSKKHPSLMGSTMEKAWSEIVRDLQPVFARAESLRCATSLENSCFFVERDGFVEETFFSVNFVPITNQYDKVEGFYNSGFETTEQKIWERRVST